MLFMAATAFVAVAPAGALEMDESAAEQVTPERWTRSVCREVSTWLKARGDVDTRFAETLSGLSGGTLSAKAAKTRLSRATAEGVAASDSFAKEVKAAGTPKVDGGKQVARAYVKTLADYGDVYKQARTDFARAKTANKERFITTAQEINGTLAADLAAVGIDPVEDLRAVPELALGITASCGDVASFLMTKIDQPCQAALTTARHLSDINTQGEGVPLDSPQFEALGQELLRTFSQLQNEVGGTCNVSSVIAPCRRPFEDAQHTVELWKQFPTTDPASPQGEALVNELTRQFEVLRTDLQSMCR